MAIDLKSLRFNLKSLHDAYAAGAVAEDVMLEVLRRIQTIDDPGIFLHCADASALAHAVKEIGAFNPDAKPLWGVPFAVKDNIDVKGMPTTAACPDFAYMPNEDAFVIAHLRAAGAIPIGKTNLDQFATGLVGVRTPHPAPKNAVDPAIVPGGSSSGSGVIVAHGAVTFALGTDTAGSGRVPAALNNIVGLKPSLGTASTRGVIPACRTLDTVSVFGLTVEDAFAAFSAMAGYDAADAYSRPIGALSMSALPMAFSVGVPDAASRIFFGDEAQAQSYAQTLQRLEQLGATIVELDFEPLYEVAALLYHGPWVAERYAAIRDVIETTPSSLHPVTRGIVEGARNFTAADTFDAVYRLADLRRQTAPMIDNVDMLCVPSIPTFYTVDDLIADPVRPNTRLGTYTNFVNLLDMCGIAVPTAPRPDGRPGSITFLAPWGKDGLIASAADLLHRSEGPKLGATAQNQQITAKITPSAHVGANDISVALVGAHMQGLPLNHQILERGGHLLFAGETAPEYRLYALAGEPPARPGMVRQNVDGAAIAVEVWSMPAASFGAFMKDIPQPLGIGTITLSDGQEVKGFLCEQAGLAGAEDITRYGGWRNYIKSIALG